MLRTKLVQVKKFYKLQPGDRVTFIIRNFGQFQTLMDDAKGDIIHQVKETISAKHKCDNTALGVRVASGKLSNITAASALADIEFEKKLKTMPLQDLIVKECGEDSPLLWDLFNVELMAYEYEEFKKKLKRLSGKDMKALNLRWERDMTLEEIGNEFCLTKDAVHKWMLRIHQHLREEMVPTMNVYEMEEEQ